MIPPVNDKRSDLTVFEFIGIRFSSIAEDCIISLPEWLIDRVGGEGEHGAVVGGVTIGVDLLVVGERNFF